MTLDSTTLIMDIIISQSEKEILLQLGKILENGPDEIVGSLEYMIRKITTHPEPMKEVDYLAAANGMKMVSFLKLCSLYNIN